VGVRRAGLFSLVAASGALALSCGDDGGGGAGPPPPPAIVTAVVRADVPVELEWNATLEGSNTAEIRPQVGGYLLAILYRQGSYVENGTPLFQIDDRTYRQSLREAEGQLAQAQAAYERASGDVRRYTPLASSGAVSREELAHAEADRDAARAQSAAARAAVRDAQLSLSFANVVSPIDGIAGIVNVEIGALVEPQTVLTTVSTLDPIKVRFAISERQYLEAAAVIRRLTLKGPEPASSKQSEDSLLRLFLVNGREYSYPGTLERVGLAIDPGTGTLPLEAYFPNPELLLRPGQFATIRLRTGEGRGVLVIPQRALTELQGIDQVAVVDPESQVVSIKRVTVGPRVGALAVIEEGVKEGDLVVIEGLQGLSSGTRVSPRRGPPVELPDASQDRAREPAPNGGGG
jgi:membrane fusion protein (multidrug efflux system)